MRRGHAVVPLLVSLIGVTCGRGGADRSERLSPADAQADLAIVREIVSTEIGVPLSMLDDDRPLSSQTTAMPFDELAFVEIILKIEERLGITVSDEVAAEFFGRGARDMPEMLDPAKVTIEALVRMASAVKADGNRN
jgi:acyl carrier protein